MRTTRSDDTVLQGAFVPDRCISRTLPAGGLGLFILANFGYAEPTFAAICRVGGGCGRTATSARPSELPVQFSRKQLSSGVPLLAVVAFHARDQFQEIDQAKFPVELGPR